MLFIELEPSASRYFKISVPKNKLNIIPVEIVQIPILSPESFDDLNPFLNREFRHINIKVETPFSTPKDHPEVEYLGVVPILLALGVSLGFELHLHQLTDCSDMLVNPRINLLYHHLILS